MVVLRERESEGADFGYKLKQLFPIRNEEKKRDGIEEERVVDYLII